MTGPVATTLRSLLFNVAFYAWTVGLGLLCLPFLAVPAAASHWLERTWAAGLLLLCRTLVGIRLEVRGRENLPSGAVLVAAKHQSAWDTFVFHMLLIRPAMVMKRELFHLPIFGWFARRWGMIGVERSAGARALRQLVVEARRAAAAGRPIVIFPEGTRTAPGHKVPYQPGVAALYRELGVPAVPVAVNSGLYWPRRSFRKRPGTIVLEILPAIPPGLDRRRFMAELEARIETASDALVREAVAAAPQLAPLPPAPAAASPGAAALPPAREPPAGPAGGPVSGPVS